MGAQWDAFVPGPELWRKVLRVLKPGAYAFVFAGTRTQHLMGIALAIAGFEIVDGLAWLYGQGMPKAMALDVLVDRELGHRREAGARALPAVSDEARAWAGWSYALKPAFEPVIVARKPFPGTYAASVLRYGTAALHVDACRVTAAGPSPAAQSRANSATAKKHSAGARPSGFVDRSSLASYTAERPGELLGRWPPNVLLGHVDGCGAGACVEGCPGAELDVQSGILRSGTNCRVNASAQRSRPGAFGAETRRAGAECITYGDEGPASRFFPQFAAEAPFRYVPKASSRERDAGCEALAQGPSDPLARHRARRMDTPEEEAPLRPDGQPSGVRANRHPSVKPVSLMRWIVRLIARPGVVIVDPCMGSGSTLVAAIAEGVRAIGIEKDAEGEGHVDVARARCAHAMRQKGSATR